LTPRILSFVSGKGGVGKTAISANFARLCSHRWRSLIIDFDFSNQGLTGLLHPYVRSGFQSSKNLFATQESTGPLRVIQISQSLYFLPAYDPNDNDRFLFLPKIVDTDYRHVSGGIAQIASAYNIEVVIIDCHGGLDASSYFGFRLGDACIVVTEADIVTFNGTLELLDFYKLQSQWQDAADDPGIKRVSTVPLSGEMHFLLNRTSTRFEYRTLIAAYREQIAANFENLRPKFQVFPHDNLLAASFSDYPFYIDLLPESIFTQKLEYLCENLQGERPQVPGRGLFYRLFERRSKKAIARLTRSADDTRAQMVYMFVFLAQLGIGITIIMSLFSSLENTRSLGLPPELLYIFGFYIIAGFAAITDLFASRFYRDRLRYEFRLFKRGVRGIEGIFVLRILRLAFTRLALLGFAAMIILFSMTGAIWLSEIVVEILLLML
jgi:MinD-like ATPase involved in chromosome partitioning or flagellar assembly